MRILASAICFAAIATSSTAEPFVIEDGHRTDFYAWPSFEAHYVYPDPEPGDPAREFVGFTGQRRSDGTYALRMIGIEPTASFPHRRCEKDVVAVVDGSGLLVDDPSGSFGRFTVRPDGEYVRVAQIEPGGCAVPGLYFLPKPVD